MSPAAAVKSVSRWLPARWRLPAVLSCRMRCAAAISLRSVASRHGSGIQMAKDMNHYLTDLGLLAIFVAGADTSRSRRRKLRFTTSIIHCDDQTNDISAERPAVLVQG